ncbi:MAG: DUF4265 domain-containing protein [Pseudomonadota bacterium]
MEDKKNVLINVYAGKYENSPIFEELPANQLTENTYELLSSPGLALNLAKGDIVEIVNKEQPAKILRRGGNFCIQIYSEDIPTQDIDNLEKNIVRELHGTLDGIHDGNLALSVPASAGVDKIKEFFDSFTEKTGIQWYFCNIYENFEDVNDETLLDWWL